MGLSIRATASNGETIESPVSHFDLLAATYGIGDNVPLRSVVVFLISMMVASAALGAALIEDDAMMRIVLLTVAFQAFGYQIVGTARTRHMVKTLSETSSNKYLPYLAASASSYLIGAAAATLCVFGGPIGIAIGIALVIANPIARFTGDIGFAFRVWNAKRLERKMAKARETGKKEGLGD